MALFDGVSRIDFSVATTTPEVTTVAKLFKLSTSLASHNCCLTPLTAPQGTEEWDLTYLSCADLLVWKLAGDLSESGGGLLLDLAGTLRDTAFPPGFCAGMQVRLDNISTRFLVGVKNFAVALAASKVVAACGSARSPSTISPGKHDPEATVGRKAAGCVVEYLNGDLYTLRNKTLSAERMSRVGGALRECGAQRLDRLMSDLNFVVTEFKGVCMHQSYRSDLLPRTRC